MEFVPLETLEQMSRSPDPVQQTLAALMIAYAGGDAMPESRQLAGRHGIRLHSLREYAERFSEG